MKAFPTKAASSMKTMYLLRLGPAQRVLIFLVLTVALVLITIAVLPFLVSFGPWGYLAGFVITLMGSATVVIPAPGFASVVLMATELNPIIMGVASGVGGTIGELSAYWLGAQGQGMLEGHRLYDVTKRHMERHGGWTLFAVGLIPFIPVDIGGIIAGTTRYPVWRFLLYLGLGKVIMTTGVLYASAKAFEWAEPYLRWLT
ncbi:MAG: putative membrane protein YdjX, TVP38/TMEM64 family, SNARE-associated domain [Chloroflexi bacterium]|jgi:uncharacterized membrane protein YdjX (TVP38/TMEM64 family)|nr:MAG: putative membrane protein YdjX, TVP38/TMEM64 family, SNARE-associated domain [Chloroflexota bacterium]